MVFLTYAQIKEKVVLATDTGEEDFVTDSELMGYCNDAIKRCEALIHTLYEDYFRTSAYLPLVSGTSAYSLPSDIYANKIRKIFYNSGANGYVYEIAPFRSLLKSLEAVEYARIDGTGNIYSYDLENSTASGFKIVLLPVPQETNSQNVRIYYLRTAKQVSSDSDFVDIPEFYSYIVAFMKYRVFSKEGNQVSADLAAELKDEEKLMIETLTNRVPDENNLIPLDLSAYSDMV